MSDNKAQKPKVALVYGTLPNYEEVDHYRLLTDEYDVQVVTTQSISGYISETSRFDNLTCIALPDYDQNPTYIPGLEKVLAGFDIVIVKERLGLYAFQALKAKFKHKFKLLVSIDNLSVCPAEDIDEMRTIREQVMDGADGFLVQSENAKNSLIAGGVYEGRVHILNPWCEKITENTKKSRAEARTNLGIAESSFVIGYTGQLEWEESLSQLASSIALLEKTNPSQAEKVRVVFCGIGSFATQLKQTLVTLGIDDKAIFVAPSRSAYNAIYEASDVIFMAPVPARDQIEGDGYRVISAMTNKVTLLASRTPIIDEFAGKHRVDFCTGSTVSLNEAIQKAAKSATLRKDIVQKNSDKINKQFSLKVSKKEILALFKEVSSMELTQTGTSVNEQVAEVEDLVQTKQYIKAIDHIESIFATPDLTSVTRGNLYRLVGDCFAKLNDLDGAKNAYIQSVELDSYAYKSYIGLGTVSLMKNSPDIAVIHFQKAVSLAPQDEMANLGLGLAFQSLGELHEASKWIQKSLDLDAYNTPAIFSLVKIAYETEDYDMAISAIDTYIESHPNNHSMIFTLAGLELRRKNFERVVDLTESILKVDPMDEKARSLKLQAQKSLSQTTASSHG